MTMSLWFVQTIEDLQDADPKFNRLVESATALTAKGQKIAVLSAEHAQVELRRAPVGTRRSAAIRAGYRSRLGEIFLRPTGNSVNSV